MTATIQPAPVGTALRAGPRVPVWVWLVAVAAALLHMAPYWRAESQAPAGRTFTGNLSISPDYMQYRVWMRQTQAEGPLVRNVFTSTPNRAYLPVALYWVIGSVSQVTGIAPEWVYAWAGALVAIAFTVVLWRAIRRFIDREQPARWAFGIIMVGGGLGGYIVLLEGWWRAQQNPLIRSVLLTPFEPVTGSVIFERFRGNYVVQALFDTHFLLFWLVTIIALMSLHSTLRGAGWRGVATTAGCFAIGTLLHVYEGVTLLAVLAGVLALGIITKVVDRRRASIVMAACTVAVVVVLVPLVWFAVRSGIPAPTWRGEHLLFAVVIAAYPFAFAMIGWGFGEFWRERDFDRVFLVGWALGCLTLALSGPIFPYPDRGTMTLSIPLTIIGVLIWRSRGLRLRAWHVAALALLVGTTPITVARAQFRRTTYRAADAHKWVGAEHTAIIAALDTLATRTDVLVAGQSSLRWLAPEYPGVHFAGHFFLTPDFDARQAELAAFFGSATAEERVAMLHRWTARWLFVDSSQEPATFRTLPGLRVVTETNAGSLFEVAQGSGQ